MRGPYAPRPIRVEAAADGRPVAVGQLDVAQVREEWVVEDGWWTGEPLRRHYFEVVLGDGRNVVVFRDESDRADGRDRAQMPGRPGAAGRWYLQRA